MTWRPSRVLSSKRLTARFTVRLFPMPEGIKPETWGAARRMRYARWVLAGGRSPRADMPTERLGLAKATARAKVRIAKRAVRRAKLANRRARIKAGLPVIP